jgi:hypothetical protein
LINGLFSDGLLVLTLICLGTLGFEIIPKNYPDELHQLRLLAFGTLSIFMIGFDFYLFQDALVRRKQDRFSITPMVSALQRLASRAAFLEDHAASNEDERLVITLRLAEGEAALEYAAWVLHERNSGEPAGSTRRYRSQIASL